MSSPVARAHLRGCVCVFCDLSKANQNKTEIKSNSRSTMSSPPPPPVDGNGRVIPEDEVRVKRFLIREVESRPPIWKHCHPGQRSGSHKQSNLSSEAWQGIMLNLREAFKVEVLLTKAGIQICRKYLRIDFQTYPNYQKCSKIHSNLDSTIRRH